MREMGEDRPRPARRSGLRMERMNSGLLPSRPQVPSERRGKDPASVPPPSSSHDPSWPIPPQERTGDWFRAHEIVCRSTRHGQEVLGVGPAHGAKSSASGYQKYLVN